MVLYSSAFELIPDEIFFKVVVIMSHSSGRILINVGLDEIDGIYSVSPVSVATACSMAFLVHPFLDSSKMI
jgi:hypothetical protein